MKSLLIVACVAVSLPYLGACSTKSSGGAKGAAKPAPAGPTPTVTIPVATAPAIVTDGGTDKPATPAAVTPTPTTKPAVTTAPSPAPAPDTTAPTITFTAPTTSGQAVSLSGAKEFAFTWTTTDDSGASPTSVWALYDTSDCSGAEVASGSGTSVATRALHGHASVKVSAADAANNTASTCSPGIDRIGFIGLGVNQNGAGDFAVLGATKTLTFLSGTDPVLGRQLWVTDGTPVGTHIVMAINPNGDSNPGPGFQLSDNGPFLFTANDGTHGTQIWATDGTEAGTQMIKDAGGLLTNVGTLAKYGAKLFFAGTSASAGSELWVTDGTPAGTTMVKDLLAGANGSNPFDFYVFNNTLYFFANSTANVVSLWKTDGSAAGTAIVNTTTQFSSVVGGLNSAGNNMFFAAVSGATGLEPYVSDGTNAGTKILDNMVAGAGSGITGAFQSTAMGGDLYFGGTKAATGSEVWKTDGTAAGETALEVNSGAGSSNPTSLTTVGNDTVLFWANDGVFGNQPYVTDGTTVKKLTSFATGASSYGVTATMGAKAYLGVTRDNTDEADVWVTDGTTNGTTAITDNTKRNCHLVGTEMSTLYMTCRELGDRMPLVLWTSDGTAAKTAPAGVVSDASSGLVQGDLSSRILFNDKVVFAGIDGAGSVTNRLYSYDAAAGMLTALNSTATSFNSFTVADGKLYFVATTPQTGPELWVSDGTPAGTVMVLDINPGVTGGAVTDMTAGPNGLFFLASTGGAVQVWGTDGTPGGTTPVSKTFFGSTASPHGLFVLNSDLYVSVTSGAATLIEKVNPGATNTAEAGSVGETCAAGFSNCHAVLNNTLVYGCVQPSKGAELCLFDPAQATTTQLIMDINTGATASNPDSMTVLGNKILFAASTAAQGRAPYVTDGTAGGTMSLNIFTPVGSASPANITVVGNDAFFSTTSSGHNPLLYKTDGTPGGTVPLANSSTMAGGGQMSNFFVLGSTLYFTSNKDGAGAMELWTSNGTENGTVLVQPNVAIESGFQTSGGEQVVLGKVGPTIDAYVWQTK